MPDPYAEYHTAQPPAPIDYPPPGALQPAGFRCPRCGYDLTGAVIGGQCSECGSHINPQHLANAPVNSMAITSMVMGILALALCIAYGIPTLIFAPLGIIFGHIASAQIRTGRYSPSSSGFMWAGLICSYSGLGLVLSSILVIVLVVVLF